MNELYSCLSPLQVPVKPMIAATKMIPNHKDYIQVHEKRKADSNDSEGPLKKRRFAEPVPSSAYDNMQSCTSKMIEHHIRALNLIQSLNKTTNFSLCAQVNPSLVNIANGSSIYKSQYYDKLRFYLMQDPLNLKSTTLDTLLRRSMHQKLQSSFGRGKCKSVPEISLNILDNELFTPNKRLSKTQDKDNLSELQCLIRDNIELFTATEQDKNTYFR